MLSTLALFYTTSLLAISYFFLQLNSDSDKNLSLIPVKERLALIPVKEKQVSIWKKLINLESDIFLKKGALWLWHLKNEQKSWKN